MLTPLYLYLIIHSFTRWADTTRASRRTGTLQLGQPGIDEEFSFCGRANQNSVYKSFKRLRSAQSRHRDRYMDYMEEVAIVGFEERVIAYINPIKREWWIVLGWYWVCSALLMSWVYRWMIARRSRKLTLTILEQVEVSF